MTGLLHLEREDYHDDQESRDADAEPCPSFVLNRPVVHLNVDA